MKHLILLRLTIILLIGISFSHLSYSQTTTTVTASCGKCGRSVPSTSSVGGTCPHCGARWDRENKSTTTSDNSIYQFPPLLQGSYLLPRNTRTYGDESNLYENSTVIRNCKLRSSPSTNSEILGLLAKNSSIIIKKRKGDWLKITYNGNLEGEFGSYVGWIHNSNVVE